MLWFILIVFVRPLSVKSLTICSLFRTDIWPSAGKELTSWLSAGVVLLYAVLIVCIPLPFGVFHCNGA